MPLHVYATKVALPALDPKIQVHAQRTRTDAGLAEHLDGFAEFLLAQGARPVTPRLFAVLQHVSRVRHHLSVEVPAERLDAFASWLRRANAVCLSPDGAVRDPDGLVLVDPESGESEIGAKLPHPSDARMAKTYNESQLKTMGLEELPPLPPGPGEDEVELREAAEIAERTWSLQHKLRDMADRPVEVVETVALLQWVASVVSILPLPLHRVSAEEVLARFDGLRRDAFVSDPEIRPASEILAQLDLHHRLLWVVSATEDPAARPLAALEPEVVAARHAALEWITSIPSQ